MPQDETEPAEAHDWLNRARAALILAQQLKPQGAMWEDQCYLAQQRLKEL